MLAELQSEQAPPPRGMMMATGEGDLEFTWTPENDEFMRAFIQQKMDAGLVFYIIKESKGRLLPMGSKWTKLKTIADLKDAQVRIADKDLSALFASGKIEAHRTQDKVEVIRPAANVNEAVSHRTVAIPRVGGG